MAAAIVARRAVIRKSSLEKPWLSAHTAFLSMRWSPSARPIVLTVLPSPRGGGIVAVTTTRLARRGPSSVAMSRMGRILACRAIRTSLSSAMGERYYRVENGGPSGLFWRTRSAPRDSRSGKGTREIPDPALPCRVRRAKDKAPAVDAPRPPARPPARTPHGACRSSFPGGFRRRIRMPDP